MKPWTVSPVTTTVALPTLALCVILSAGCSGATSEESEQRTFDDLPRPLIVEGGDAEIEFITADIDQVRVTRSETGQAGGEWGLEGGTLSLDAECALFSRCQVRYVVELPADTDLSVNTNNGLVSVTGVSAMTEVTSSHGPVLISEVSGPVDVSSGNGDLTLQGVDSDIVSLATDNGDIDAALTQRPTEVEVSTNNGDAALALPDGPYAVFETVDNGEIITEIDVDPYADSTVNARTDNGTITLTSH